MAPRLAKLRHSAKASRGAGETTRIARMAPAPIRILGIDPGLRNTGWGVVESDGSRLVFVACGTVHSDAGETLSQRLRQLHEGLAAVIAAHAPHEAAVEETFVNRDPQSALKLGQARGIALLAPALAGLSVAEYAANLVKKTVVGAGHAEKAQVAMMVRVLLPKCDAKTADAADALAVAICHAQHRGARALAASVASRIAR
jgi:crossover junction endodeoxyribonuclease RuvC